MPKAHPAITSFNGGELSPRMAGRVDFDKYGSGCYKCENFVLTVQGPGSFRPGTHYADETNIHTGTVARVGWLRPFVVSYDAAYVLEFTSFALGFFTNRARLSHTQAVTGAVNNGAGLIRLTVVAHGFLDNQRVQVSKVGGVPNSTGTWTVDVINANTIDLLGSTFAGAYTVGGIAVGAYLIANPVAITANTDGGCPFDTEQLGNTMYLTNGVGMPYKLTRLTASTFSIASLSINDGPYMDQNIDQAITVQPSAAFGGINIVGVGNPFTAAMVGALIRAEPKNLSSVKPWEPGKVVAANDLRRSDGKTYAAVNAGTTGSVRPTHDYGSAFDGSDPATAVEWLFQEAGYGVARITGFTNGNLVAASVLSVFPINLVTVASYRWSIGAWGSHNEFPKYVAFYRDRLVFAGERLLWFSPAGDYESMAPDEFGQQTTESAITIEVVGREANPIRWLSAQDRLLVGTGAGEFAVGEITDADPLGPANIKCVLQSTYGARDIGTESIGEATFFTQRNGVRVREMAYSLDLDKYAARDVTVLADHAARSGIIDFAYQKSPDSILWCALASGNLAAFTYEREQDVYGWHRHFLGRSLSTGANVESVCCIPSPDGTLTDTWFMVERALAGPGIVHYVEWMDHRFETGDDPEDNFFLDSGLSFDGANAVLGATLTPGAGATVDEQAGVSMTSAPGAFVSGDVGKLIHYRYQDEDDEEWHTAKAEITGFTSTAIVTATIRSPFPSLAVIASGLWRITATTLSGLSHLEGETVGVVTNGAEHADRTVSAGAITLSVPASKAHVGLKYRGAISPMRIEAGAADGTAQGKIKRTTKVVFRLVESLGGSYGPREDNQIAFKYREPANAMDEPPPLFTGDQTVDWQGGYDTDGFYYVVQDKPFPLTLAAIFPKVNTQDR